MSYESTGTELPSVGMTTPMASQVADVFSLAQDFSAVSIWCREIETIEADKTMDEDRKMRLEHALWKAALITYRRCWTHNPSAIAAGNQGSDHKMNGSITSDSTTLAQPMRES